MGRPARQFQHVPLIGFVSLMQRLVRTAGLAVIASFAGDTVIFICSRMDWLDWKVSFAVYMAIFFLLNWWMPAWSEAKARAAQDASHSALRTPNSPLER